MNLMFKQTMDDVRELVMVYKEQQETGDRAEEGIKSRDAQILCLKDSLAAAIKERDEAREYCKKMLLEKMTVLQSAPNSAISCTAKGIDGLSSSDGEESIASSPRRIPTE
ncbi:hypothetical protein SASPL_152451 [Salvia splendens]|uniref:Uncharacterized protein n=1 Tax=Salvia splendens TaxID=180675 RepID=A0A8X8W3M1_SALSN|nr:hypothetical protein SASPL_152451 [Salvia splendens]